MTRTFWLAWVLVAVCSGCNFSRIVPPEQLEQTERGGFTASGRYFLVGVRPEAVPSAVAQQPPNPPRGRIFPKDSLVVTSSFGGGLYVLSKR